MKTLDTSLILYAEHDFNGKTSNAPPSRNKSPLCLIRYLPSSVTYSALLMLPLSTFPLLLHCILILSASAAAASTFACRVTAGTRSDIYSCICSGIGTLKGPLHGGANEAALKMLIPLTSIQKAQRRVGGFQRRKQRLAAARCCSLLLPPVVRTAASASP